MIATAFAVDAVAAPTAPVTASTVPIETVGADAMRLIAEPHPSKPGCFIGRLEDSGEIVVVSRQPLADGARVLLARDFDPATPLTLRHQGKDYDSFKPAPISQWAKWTYEESDKAVLKRRAWMPFAAGAGTPKSGAERSTVPDAHRERIAFYDDPPPAKSVVAS